MSGTCWRISRRGREPTPSPSASAAVSWRKSLCPGSAGEPTEVVKSPRHLLEAWAPDLGLGVASLHSLWISLNRGTTCGCLKQKLRGSLTKRCGRPGQGGANAQQADA